MILAVIFTAKSVPPASQENLQPRDLFAGFYKQGTTVAEKGLDHITSFGDPVDALSSIPLIDFSQGSAISVIHKELKGL